MERPKDERTPITQEIWERQLCIYVQDGNAEQFNKLWNAYPDFAVRMMHEFDNIVSRSDTHVTPEETLASWERMKARLREEFGEDFV